MIYRENILERGKEGKREYSSEKVSESIRWKERVLENRKNIRERQREF